MRSDMAANGEHVMRQETEWRTKGKEYKRSNQKKKTGVADVMTK